MVPMSRPRQMMPFRSSNQPVFLLQSVYLRRVCSLSVDVRAVSYYVNINLSGHCSSCRKSTSPTAPPRSSSVLGGSSVGRHLATTSFRPSLRHLPRQGVRRRRRPNRIGRNGGTLPPVPVRRQPFYRRRRVPARFPSGLPVAVASSCVAVKT